jgi:hypothetical protein
VHTSPQDSRLALQLRRVEPCQVTDRQLLLVMARKMASKTAY